MSTKATLEAYIDSHMLIAPDEITVAIDIDVRKEMLTLDHNEHPNIQGGAVGERYHLALAELTGLQDLLAMDFGDLVTDAELTAILADYVTESALATALTDYALITDLDDYVAKAGSAMVANADITFSGGGEVLGLPNVPSVGDAATSKTYVDTELANKVALAGDTMDNAAALSFPNFPGTGNITIDGSSQSISIISPFGGSALLQVDSFSITDISGGAYMNPSEIGVTSPATNHQIRIFPNYLEIENFLEGNAIIKWLTGKKTLDFSGTNLTGLSITGTGKKLAFGDWFSDTVPYMYLGEYNDADTDAFEFYGQKGFFFRTGSTATTALIRGTQLGLVGVKNESPVYDLDLTGDFNLTGNYRKGGTVGYIVSALGAASGVAPTLANCRTRTITVNGVTVKMVIDIS